MSMLLPSRHEAANPWAVVASSAATATSSSSSPAVDHHHHHLLHHSHIPAPHASKLHQLQHQQHFQDDKALGAGMTINMQSVVDADARRPHRYMDARENHPAVLPPLASSGSPATISPPNTRRYPPVLAPLRVLPDYCRFPGCANFGKMQGFCHDHIHGRPAAAGAIAPVVSRPLLPGLRSVVSPDMRASSAMSSPEPSSSPSVAYGAFQPSLYPPSTLKRPPPPPVMIPAMPQSAFAVASKRPRVLDESDSSSSTASTAKTRSTKCRRENCGNDARRKGLCMEHGGRHFCKMAGCTKCAHRGGFCISHGGGRRCAVANCAKSAQSGGICYSHGGGKRCATDGCSHAARSGGYCIKHGKQQRQLQ
jgi:hypothetical protein